MTAGGYLRFPAIGGDTVVFACEDDLWSVAATGGDASRLTAGVSEAGHPRLSPDGRAVAFVGADDGPTEVYVLTLPGGPARRLTHQAAKCVVVGWRGDEVLYASTAEQPDGFGTRLFAVPAGGGAPRVLDLGPASAISHGPAGEVVLGRSIADPARWKRYRGGAAGELWVSAAGGPYTRLLPGLPANLADPCWVGGRIFFLSDHDGVGNVWSARPDGTELRRHSDHAEHYARGLATDGRRLVWSAGARLFLLDPATGGPPERVPVRLSSARTQHRRRFVPAAEHLESARPSPDGTGLALVSRGRAYTLAHWSGPVRRHGRTDGVRYRLLSWLAGGDRLVAVAGDERPDERLVLLPADGGGAEVELATDDIGCVTELAASPATGLVALATNRQQLWTVDTDEPEPRPRLVDASAHERIEDLAWSPDGRWLAYTYPNSPRTSAIKVVDATTGQSFWLTRPVLRDARPAFDPGGRYLYFLGQRDLTPEHDQVEAGVGFPFGARPYLVTLTDAEPAPFVPGPYAPGDPPAAPPDGLSAVQIDLGGIDRRVVPLPVPEGRYAEVLGLHGRVLLLSVPVTAPDPARPPGAPPEGTVTLVELATGEVTEDYLERVDALSTDAGSRVLLYRAGNRLRVVEAGADPDAVGEHDTVTALPGRDTGWVDLDRVQVSVDPAAEWRQMFREAWRLQRESFWSAGMAGVDWDRMYDRYAPLAGLVASRSELSDLIWELQGELATSHAYERGGDHRRPDPHAQGFLGVDWDVADGEWRVARVLRGDPWRPEATSPLNRPGTDVRPGDAVVAVDGQPVGPAGPGELLVGQADREVELTVARPGQPRRRVTVRATASETRARYLDWVRVNRRYVRVASRGRLGYLHVPDMFKEGYADFVRGFLAELDREALVVDVRYNGGGHVSPLLLDRLSRRRAGAEHGRWSGVAPYPLEAPRGAMVALVNEQTGSDGEIFGHVFRSLGLGRLVGVRSWGGVIATWPRHTLVDGTVTTQPEFRYYLSEIGDGLENHGVEPDVEVPVAPGPRRSDDRQLAVAVELLLADLDRGRAADAARTVRHLPTAGA